MGKPDVLGSMSFRRLAEPREGAFDLLVPEGWLLEGGIVRANLMQQQVSAQTIAAKVDFAVLEDGVEISATVSTADRTGVEMEALTAVSVAALNLIDMFKGIDKGVEIERVRLEEKTGGKSGDWRAPD